MKKLILLSSLFFLCAADYAQIEKGTYVPSLFLNFAYSSSPDNYKGISSKTNDRLDAGAGIGFGKFIKTNLLLTGSLSYGYTHLNSTFSSENNIYDNYSDNSYLNSFAASEGLFKYKFLGENFAARFGAVATAAYSDGFSRRSYYTNYVDNSGNLIWVYDNSTAYQNTISLQGNLQAGILYF